MARAWGNIRPGTTEFVTFNFMLDLIFGKMETVGSPEMFQLIYQTA